MAAELVLIVEDDADIVEMLEYNLVREGYRVKSVGDGSLAVEAAIRLQPSLVILDLMLPGADGLDVCRLLRSRSETSGTPILMLTARGEESDVVRGLEAGADDYVTKPFSNRELLARVRALLRRGTGAGGDGGTCIEVGPVAIDPERFLVTVDGEPIELTRTEFRLLRALFERRGRVLTRDQLIARMTEGKTFITSRNVDVHVRAIRKKLGGAGDLIVTVRGVGYKCRD